MFFPWVYIWDARLNLKENKIMVMSTKIVACSLTNQLLFIVPGVVLHNEFYLTRQVFLNIELSRETEETILNDSSHY